MPDLKQALVYTKPNGCKDAWWKEYPDANIGLATGEVNGIPVPDIDRNHAEGERGRSDPDREGKAAAAGAGPGPDGLSITCGQNDRT